MAEQMRVALVTGANRGLGKAIGRSLATRDMHVVISGRDRESARDAASSLVAEGLSVSAVHLDVTDPACPARVVEQVRRRCGRLDVLVNNAGVALDEERRSWAVDFEVVQATLDTNLLGVWRCCAAAVPHMVANGYGRIVNISSHHGSLSTMAVGSPAYRVSKAALNALTRVLAAELAGTGVLVNAVAPGRVDTRMSRRPGARSADEAADALVWLATLPTDGPTGALFADGVPLPW